MATTAKKSTKTTSAATPRKTPTKKAAKRATKKTPAKQSNKQTGSKPSTQTTKNASQSSSTEASNTASLSLLERDPKVVLESAGYAAVSVAHDAVAVARSVPTRLGRAAKSVPVFVRNAPENARGTVDSVSTRISRDAKRCVNTFTSTFDDKAAAGRKVVDDLANSERIGRIRDQASTTRDKTKGAVTSAKQAASQAADAAEDDMTKARSEAKGAATSAKQAVEAAEKDSDN